MPIQGALKHGRRKEVSYCSPAENFQWHEDMVPSSIDLVRDTVDEKRRGERADQKWSGERDDQKRRGVGEQGFVVGSQCNAWFCITLGVVFQFSTPSYLGGLQIYLFLSLSGVLHNTKSPGACLPSDVADLGLICISLFLQSKFRG